jgi:hypothetical protein
MSFPLVRAPIDRWASLGGVSFVGITAASPTALFIVAANKVTSIENYVFKDFGADNCLE